MNHNQRFRCGAINLSTAYQEKQQWCNQQPSLWKSTRNDNERAANRGFPWLLLLVVLVKIRLDNKVESKQQTVAFEDVQGWNTTMFWKNGTFTVFQVPVFDMTPTSERSRKSPSTHLIYFDTVGWNCWHLMRCYISALTDAPSTPDQNDALFPQGVEGGRTNPTLSQNRHGGKLPQPKLPLTCHFDINVITRQVNVLANPHPPTWFILTQLAEIVGIWCAVTFLLWQMHPAHQIKMMPVANYA